MEFKNFLFANYRRFHFNHLLTVWVPTSAIALVRIVTKSVERHKNIIKIIIKIIIIIIIKIGQFLEEIQFFLETKVNGINTTKISLAFLSRYG